MDKRPAAGKATAGNGGVHGVSVAAPPTMSGKNGGRLRRGNPGNSGRSAFQLRVMCCDAAIDRIEVLTAIADNNRAAKRDRIAAMALLVRTGIYGDGEVPRSFVRDALQRMAFDITQKLNEFMPSEHVKTFMDQLGRHWDGK
jgi:hypothetical protein